MKARNFIKKIPQHRSFSVNIVNFLRKTFFVEHFWLLLLTGLPQYSKVSWGVCFLISHLLVLSIFRSKTYTKRCTSNSLLPLDKPVSSLLELIYITCFQFQNMFWKNSCFWFWWKTYTKRFTNNYESLYHVSKIFLRLPFAFDQVLSISGDDLDNGRIQCKQKKWR